jgi:hypothetical protein
MIQIGTAALEPPNLGTIYRSESYANRITQANLRECPDCGHAAYHHTLAGCLANNGVNPICVCQMPRDDVDSHHEDHEEHE